MAKFVSILSAVVFLAGCQSGLKYETQVRKITIKTDPYNARVYQINPVDKNETFLGLSPIEDQPVNVIKKFSGNISTEMIDYMTTQVEMVNIKVEKDGYLPYTGNLATEKNDTLTHRIELEQLPR